MKCQLLFLSGLVFIFVLNGCGKKGCTDPDVDNYDPDATKTDYSCDYTYGCMDTLATNYDPLASRDCCCKYLLEYKVSGSANLYDVTYENSSGGTSQESNVTNSWSYSFSAGGDTWVYLSAQNQKNTGSVTVTIKYGASTFKSSTSNGGYVIATASGTL
ncbi:MAG: hypothetical protein COC01_04955 [Bacteroidetes bacterium]|nr:MAG: hypothetical protein COC01_04955 [Bacteroidota bacterium]